jgi:cytochrome c oxidase subunit IV
MERKLAVLAATVFLVVIYGSLLNATHHWFSMVFVTFAITVVSQRRTVPRIAVAGALVGLASFFTQTHGAVSCAAIGVFLLWERFQYKTGWATLIRQEGVLIVAFTAAVLTLNAQSLATVGLSKLWYFQFTHVSEYRVSGFASLLLGLPQHPALRISALVIYVLVPLTYLFGLFRLVRFPPFFRRVAPEVESRIILLVLVGAGLFVEVLFSLNWLRLYAVCMPAIVLLTRATGGAGKMRSYAVSALLVTAGCFAAAQIWSKQASPGVVTILPGGAAVLTPQASEKLRWIAERTTPGDFFFQASWPGLYIPLALRNPLFLDTVSPYDKTRPEYIEGAVIDLERRHVRYVLWSKQMDEKAQPGVSLAAIRDYVRRQYRCVHVFTDGDEMLERKTVASTATGDIDHR